MIDREQFSSARFATFLSAAMAEGHAKGCAQSTAMRMAMGTKYSHAGFWQFSDQSDSGLQGKKKRSALSLHGKQLSFLALLIAAQKLQHKTTTADWRRTAS